MAATAQATKRSPAAEAWGLLFEFVTSLDPYWAEIAGEFGLSSAQGHALLLLQPGEGIPMNEVAKLCHCDPSNLTGIVDRLEARGLVARRPAEHDRRVKLICLTKEGTALRARALARVYQPHPAIASLSSADQRALRDILRRAFASA